MSNRFTEGLIRAIPFFERWRKRAKSLIEVEIDSAALIHNAKAFAKYSSAPVAPVLKSNAYGHGLVEVATVLEQANRKENNESQFPFFVVDSYFEAMTLRRHNIITPILVIGYTFTETICQSKLNDVIFTITSLDALQELSGKISSQTKPTKILSKKPIKIHLKIDTGMHRQGIDMSEIPEALQIIREASQETGGGTSKLIFEGIASHFADSPNPNADFTTQQINAWNKCVDDINATLSNLNLPALRYVHLSNTAGHVHHKQIRMNVSRLGLGLYGYADRPELERDLDLRPTLTMKSIIAQVKNVPASQSIGYNCAYVAPHNMTIAIVPAGYNEGIDRRLSGLRSASDESHDGTTKQTDRDYGTGQKNSPGIFIVNGHPCPIVGVVSMNITAIDVSALGENIKRDDEVIIISNNPSDPNSIKSIANKIGAIAYEMSVRIPASLRRVVK